MTVELLKLRRWAPIAFFVLGFALDIFRLGRIDALVSIVQQGTYLLVAGTLISLEYLETKQAFRAPGWFLRAWVYRDWVTHFVLGGLLSSYTIFYFKSGSLFTSFGFLLGLSGLLLINEFRIFGQNSGLTARIALFSLCLLSYFTYLVPILLGFIGTFPFLLAIAASMSCAGALTFILKNKVKDRSELWPDIRRQFLVTNSIISLLFAVLYFAKVIPPVPLSLSHIGIYHDVTKQNGDYLLTFTRPRWKFWQNGDQSFAIRPGDRIHCFVRIFSPTRFRERVQVRWLYHDPKSGWLPSDAIPLEIVGGRNEGYRGMTHKANYQPGDWRVQVETSDGRELGRIYLTAFIDDPTTERQTRIEIH
jgi:hypothetical protein